MMAHWTGWLGGAYLWIVALHVIFVIFLMAGFFMMPRFFIYHQECAVGSAEDAKWIEREDRLRRIILNPSIILVWVFGLMLAANGHFWAQGWFVAKLLLVLALSGYHGWVVSYGKALKRGERRCSDKALRLLNEVPGVTAILVVLLVFAKPF